MPILEKTLLLERRDVEQNDTANSVVDHCNLADAVEIISRLFANIVRVKKLTTLESNRGCRYASSLFIWCRPAP